ncbi:MAG TPA: hypothetical protein VJ301_01710 [Propionibacteriaceae bacterium]|nr:hypothetical protein [Propionibacteriaceae bacterium]
MFSQLGDEEPWDRHLPALVGLGRAPDKPLALNDGDGLGDGRAPACEVEAAHSKCGQLAESDAGVSEEQDDQPVGLVLAFIEPAMLAHVNWAGARLSESLDLGVGQEALLLLGRAREIDARRDVAGQTSVLDGHIEDQ